MTFGAMQAGNIFAFVPDISLAKGIVNTIIELLDSTPLTDTESTGRKPVPGEVILTLDHFTWNRFPSSYSSQIPCSP